MPDVKPVKMIGVAGGVGNDGGLSGKGRPMRGDVFVLVRGERRATSRRGGYVSEGEVKIVSFESIAEA